ncbi:hypothetical protein P8452_26712 [Trifolium repens]|nr:hypothetical protein P8452_26712 [Trifolium repens]
MRLGADAIVFSRHLNNGILTQSIGLLSYTFFMRAHLDRIVVPMVNYEFNTSTGSLDINRSSKKFDNMGSHGTKVIVYNLWFNDEGITELDFDTDPKDIRIAWDIKKLGTKPAWQRIQEEHIAK